MFIPNTSCLLINNAESALQLICYSHENKAASLYLHRLQNLLEESLHVCKFDNENSSSELSTDQRLYEIHLTFFYSICHSHRRINLLHIPRYVCKVLVVQCSAAHVLNGAANAEHFAKSGPQPKKPQTPAHNHRLKTRPPVPVQYSTLSTRTRT